MASITYGVAKKYRYLGEEEEEEGPEQSQTKALRQRILKELLWKQLSTHTSLEQQQRQHKTFVRAACEESVTASTSGLASPAAFRSVESLVAARQTLKSCGLTDGEMRLLLGEESHTSPLEAPHARRQRLAAIQDKLLRHGGRADASPRHQEEAEGVPVPGEERRPAPRQDLLPEGHPMHRLREMAERLFPSEASDPSRGEERPGTKRQNQTPPPPLPKRSRGGNSSCVYLSDKPRTCWDMQQIPKVMGGSSSSSSRPLSAPLAQSPAPGSTSSSSSSSRDRTVVHAAQNAAAAAPDPTRPFVLSLDPRELVPRPAIEANRRSVQQLRETDKFRHYSEGTPGPTLYLKNLSPRVCPRDLAALMGHFEPRCGTKLLYRILGGRMKGQAFVTFPDAETARAALGLCNGYVLHGRPLVAAFGKHSR